MYIVVGLPRNQRENDSIFMIVDGLTKSAHFIPVKSNNMAQEYARIYIDETVSLHGISLSIISDRGTQFTSQFWRSFQRGLVTQVKLITAFHP